MFKDQIMKEIDRLQHVEQLEIAILILLKILKNSGSEVNEPILIEELETILKRLGGNN